MCGIERERERERERCLVEIKERERKNVIPKLHISTGRPIYSLHNTISGAYTKKCKIYSTK